MQTYATYKDKLTLYKGSPAGWLGWLIKKGIAA